MKAPISKHQITNNIEIPISNDPKDFFGILVIWSLEIIWNLGFGFWDLDPCSVSSNL